MKKIVSLSMALAFTFSSFAKADESCGKLTALAVVVGLAVGSFAGEPKADDPEGTPDDDEAMVNGMAIGAGVGLGIGALCGITNLITKDKRYAADVNRALKERGIDIHDEQVAQLILEIPSDKASKLNANALVDTIAERIQSRTATTYVAHSSSSSSGIFSDSNLAKFVSAASTKVDASK